MSLKTEVTDEYSGAFYDSERHIARFAPPFSCNNDTNSDVVLNK